MQELISSQFSFMKCLRSDLSGLLLGGYWLWTAQMKPSTKALKEPLFIEKL